MDCKDENFNAIGLGTLAGRFLGSFWQPICLAEKAPRGPAVPVRIIGEEFTLDRGASSMQLVGPRCPYRGVTLSTGRSRATT